MAMAGTYERTALDEGSKRFVRSRAAVCSPLPRMRGGRLMSSFSQRGNSSLDIDRYTDPKCVDLAGSMMRQDRMRVVPAMHRECLPAHS